jgi:hypothetical protein
MWAPYPTQALANELLPSTKGHSMGWGWAVWTFGFAFLPPLQVGPGAGWKHRRAWQC